MTEINWELVKFKYEVLNQSLEELAKEYSITMVVLEYNAKDWTPISLEERQKLLDSSASDDISSNIQEQTKIFALLKQKFLGPKYIELETTLLHKAIKLASNIDETDKLAARTIQNLTSTLIELLKQNSALNPSTDESADPQKAWEITIVNETKDKDVKEVKPTDTK